MKGLRDTSGVRCGVLSFCLLILYITCISGFGARATVHVLSAQTALLVFCLYSLDYMDQVGILRRSSPAGTSRWHIVGQGCPTICQRFFPVEKQFSRCITKLVPQRERSAWKVPILFVYTGYSYFVPDNVVYGCWQTGRVRALPSTPARDDAICVAAPRDR